MLIVVERALLDDTSPPRGTLRAQRAMARSKSKDSSRPSRVSDEAERVPPRGADAALPRTLRRTLPYEATPTVGNKALRAAFGAAAAAGLDIGALAASQGLRLEDLSDADVRVPHDAWVALFAEIERRTGDPGIGLHVAASLPLGHWDTIDYMIAASGTLGEALARLERYFALVSTAVEHTTLREHGEVRVRHIHVAGSVPREDLWA
jgi:Arabinose-binding domain of AraC transcription regulator, N-term